MMEPVKRKDLGSVGTRSLARCESCGRIIDVEYHHQPDVDVKARLTAGERHRKKDHPKRPGVLLPLADMIWGLGSAPRMRKR